MNFGKKKTNPEDGDFPHVSKHYFEEKAPTRAVKIAPQLRWDGATTVVWGIDIGSSTTTVSFAYLETGVNVEVHNVAYWPKEFPLRDAATPGAPLPEIKSNKTYKLRETYKSEGFISHPAWDSERTANYLYTTNAANTPSAFQVRTDLPFIETAERHKFVDLIEHLLKHALSVYGAVVKPTQPGWPLVSNVVVTLPNGIPKSAEMAITDILDNVIRDVMPKVVGPTTVTYPRKPDVRLFEDDLWRNLDTAFQNDDVFLVVDWDLTSGDMVCASYKTKILDSGHMVFGTRLRSYMQATPVILKRDAATDTREGVRFANALHWCAENKHRTQKLIVRTSNPFKKPEGLLATFHKTLVEKNLQVGIRSIDPAVETGAFGAVTSRIAHLLAQSQSSEGEEIALVQDLTQQSTHEVDANARELPHAPESEPPSRFSRALSAFPTGLFGRSQDSSESYPPEKLAKLTTSDSSAPFLSTPLAWSGPASATSPASSAPPLTPAAGPSKASTIIVNTPVGSPGPIDISEEALDSSIPPPAYINGPEHASPRPEKATV
ncbi:hypothetical protein BDV93DRAFT_604240 [Ceratobasidium sp. AG-I]|nr:hypothetical protein BDV93DRAFT_604240 [Ceratobasidium sp. AG-I]